MGKLGKFVFADYTTFECDRRIFYDLGDKDPAWLQPLVPIGVNEWAMVMRKQSELVMDLGKKNEQNVYRQIQTITTAKSAPDRFGDVMKFKMDVNVLNDLYTQLTAHPQTEIYLLEFFYPITPTFLRYTLGLTATDPIPLDNVRGRSDPDSDKNTARPDVMILSMCLQGEVTELKIEFDAHAVLQKTLRTVPPAELQTRVGINIVDIKHTNEEKVGKKHFAEILFYGWTLACYLKEAGLDSKFFVSLHNNGIFPKYNDVELRNIRNIREKIVPMSWKDCEFMFDTVVTTIRRLKAHAPCVVEAVTPHVTPMCGRWCEYLPDCIASMKYDPATPPLDADIRLLPYTHTSITEQLRDNGITTMGELARNYATLQQNLPKTPNPLYADIPFLENKVRALLNQKTNFPQGGVLLSNVIPQYSPITFTFDLEIDPINERVHSFGIHTQFWAFQKSPHYALLGEWWRTWVQYLAQVNTGVGRATLYTHLLTDCNALIHASHMSGNWPQWAPENLLNDGNIADFAESLDYLVRCDPKFVEKINEYAGFVSGNPLSAVWFEYAYVNGGIDDADEYALAKELVTVLYHLLRVCIIIEHYITADASPTSIFYWGDDQLEAFRDLFERHLGHLTQDPVAPLFEYVMRWISPNQSSVQNPITHKKLFDLKAFAQTVYAFPFIIDYNWHQIAEHEIQKPGYSFRVSHKYWPPHFNYMVFKPWHEMILEHNTKIKNDMADEIKRQILHKARTIDELRTVLQQKGRNDIFPQRTEPIRSMTYGRRLFGQAFHLLAKTWYLFAKLNGTFDEIAADQIRLMYPQWSIGKLEAGQVVHLTQRPLATGAHPSYQYEMDLVDMSIYMKLDEGDYRLLLTDTERGAHFPDFELRRRTVIIQRMEWQTDHFHLITEETEMDFLGTHTNQDPWFLYPHASDPWSSKLFVPLEDRHPHTKPGLLERYNFGESWLGHWLVFRWNLIPNTPFPRITRPNFGLPELYLYAPQLLPRRTLTPNLQQPLLTTIAVQGSPLDPSQVEGINLVLNESIAAIQGPPGTGKTQTIAALIDEFILRFRQSHPDQPVHILVTALSYAAMNEVLKKVVASTDAQNRPIPASQLPRVFARSASQDIFPDVHDLLHEATWKLDGQPIPGRGKVKVKLETAFPEGFIMFANAFTLFYLGMQTIITPTFHFDLIIADEASQLPVDHFLAALQLVNMSQGALNCAIDRPDTANPVGKVQPLTTLTCDELTQVVIVGDHNQLPPVQQVEPPYNLRCILSSLFAYYVEPEANHGHGITKHQLIVNYRSNQAIVDYTNCLECYDLPILAAPVVAQLQLHTPAGHLDPWIQTLLDPSKIVGTVIHASNFETSVSVLEAEITAKLVWGYFETLKSGFTTMDQEREFWIKQIGVVAPHNAQCHLIRRNIMQLIRPRFLPMNDLQQLVTLAVASVDKFQGSDRWCIISSIGISAKEQLQAEEQFIYEITRFNVLTSRAKAKMILIASQNFLNYVPQDREIMQSAAKIREFAREFCTQSQALQIPFQGFNKIVEFRFR